MMYNFYENLENKLRIILNGDLNYLSSFNNIEFNSMCNIFRHEFNKSCKYVDIEFGNRIWRIVVEPNNSDIKKDVYFISNTMIYNGREMKNTIFYNKFDSEDFNKHSFYSSLLKTLENGVNFLLQDVSGNCKRVKEQAPFILFLYLVVYYEKSDVNLRNIIKTYWKVKNDHIVDYFEHIITNYTLYDTLDCGGIIHERYEIYKVR